MEKLRIATIGNRSVVGSPEFRGTDTGLSSRLDIATAEAPELDPSPASGSTMSTRLDGDMEQLDRGVYLAAKADDSDSASGRGKILGATRNCHLCNVRCQLVEVKTVRRGGVFWRNERLEIAEPSFSKQTSKTLTVLRSWFPRNQQSPTRPFADLSQGRVSAHCTVSH